MKFHHCWSPPAKHLFGHPLEKNTIASTLEKSLSDAYV